MNFSTTLKISITKENECRFRDEKMDIFGVKKDTKRSFLCKDRREFGVLQSTLGDLRKNSEIRIRQYEDDMRNLQWVLYNLRLEKTGLSPLGSIIAGDTNHLSSLRGMQAKSNCRQIKSIRRPLAPESTRDHGSRPSTQSSLQSLQGSRTAIPRQVKREILRRQSIRLKEKRREQLQGNKQREMQLKDTVGVYTRIKMTKGSLNYKGRPINSYEEGRTVEPPAPSSLSQASTNQFTSPMIDTVSSLSKDSVGVSRDDEKRFRKDVVNKGTQEAGLLGKLAKVIEVPTSLPRRRSVQGAIGGAKSKSTALRARKENDNCASRDSSDQNLEKEQLKTFTDLVVFSCKELKENQKDAFRKSSEEFVTIEEIPDDANHMHPMGNNLGIAKNRSETTDYSSRISTDGDNAKKVVQAVKNKVILPIRLHRQTRREKRNDLEARRERSEAIDKDNITEKTIMESNEEENITTIAKVAPLTAGKLQKLIREKVLSQSQIKSKRTNQKTVLLTDYVRTLQTHMGTTESIDPESNSPDFSETPFIAAGKKLESEDNKGTGSRTAMQRRLEMLQEQLVRLPTSFNLLEGDLVEDS